MLRKLSTWLAIIGMVLNALWPLLANAEPAGFIAPICSMVGTTTASIASGKLPPYPAPAKSGAPHCPYCAGAHNHHPALANFEVDLALPLAEVIRHPVEVIASSPSLVGLAAHPRGPPR